ncbi:MAG: glycosyltransferase family 2 protein [Endomicrobiales bacterium]|nr:glycosyltransferase family 2 protein [Endomicrobiales bacterium]
MEKQLISIIVPVYNEENNIPELYDSIKKIKDSIPGTVEVIFIDDGSTDKSKVEIENIAKQDKDVKMIALGRNYGQTIAIASGIKNSKGEIIVTLDADLQNDPGDIPTLVGLINKGNDVVSGWRKKRMDPFFSRKIPSLIANSIISFVTGLKLHDFGCTLKAYRREFVDHLSIHGEMHRLLPAYCVLQGANIVEIPVNHFPRKHGKSKYGLSRTLKVLLDLLVIKFLLSYLSKPIYVFGGIAIFSFVLGAAINLFVVIRRIYLHGQWLSPLFFIGFSFWTLSVICLLLGLIAEVLVRLYFESGNKLTYKIKSKINL